MKTFKMISISEINPFDDGHPNKSELWDEKELEMHNEGALFILSGIRKGGEVNPIAVRERVVDYFNMKKKYERLDGYKRYCACVLSGMTKIPCYIYSGEEATPGCQYGEELWNIPPKEAA